MIFLEGARPIGDYDEQLCCQRACGLSRLTVGCLTDMNYFLRCSGRACTRKSRYRAMDRLIVPPVVSSLCQES